MLATQVQYWSNQENSRHNKAMEALTKQQLIETIRHNVKGETQTDRQLVLQQQANTNNFRAITENIRHNKATEGLSWFNSFEAKRHNLASERNTMQQNYVNYLGVQSQLKNAETQRYNAETQRYTARSNALIGNRNAATNEYQAATQAKLAATTKQLNDARINKMHHDVIQGYVGLAVNGIIGASNSAQGWMRTMYPWMNLQ